MSAQPEALRLADRLKAGWGMALRDECAAELRRLHQQELANDLWHIKTAWVQDSARPGELGMHRADVLKRRIDRLAAENEALRADAERYRWMRDRGDATWKPLARRVPEGGNGIDTAIDAARSKT